MIANRIIKNTSYNTLGRFWLILVNFFLTPLILSYLGDKRFALWALFWTFSTWFMFMDLGIGSSVVREVARLAVKDCPEEVNTTLFSALAFNFLIGLLVLVFVWGGAGWLVDYMDVSEALRGDALDLAYLAPIVFVVMGLMGIFDCFLRGMQRYDLIVIISIAISFINVATVWLVLHYGYGIFGLMLAAVFVYSIQLLLLVWFSRNVFPRMRFRPAFINAGRIRQMLPFGLHLQAARFGELASYQADKIILAILTPLYYVTLYDLASKIASLLRMLPYLLTSAVLPSVAQMHAENDSRRIWMMYERGSKYLWIVSTPLFLGLCITAPLLTQLWLGHVSMEIYLAIIILSLGYWGTVNVGVLYAIAVGLGWSKPIMYITLFQAVTNLTLSWVLASSIGYVGVLYATSITLIATSIIVYLRFCHDFDRARQRDFRSFMQVLIANFPPSIICLVYLYMSGYWGWDMSEETRISVIPPLLFCFAIYGLVYMVSIRFARLLDSTDMEWLGAFFPAMLKKYLFVR